MPYRMKGTKKNLTMNDFVEVIPWDQIQQLMLVNDYKKFIRWMSGQTVHHKGVYPGDLKRFLEGRAIID